MRLAATVRRAVLAGAIVTGLVGGGGIAAASSQVHQFESRNGAITLGEIAAIEHVESGARPESVIVVRSDRVLSDEEFRIVLNGGQVPGAEVVNQVSNPPSEATLGDVVPGFVAAESSTTNSWRIKFRINGTTIEMSCSKTVEIKDGTKTTTETCSSTTTEPA